MPVNIPVGVPISRESWWRKYLIGFLVGVVFILVLEALLTPWFYAMVFLNSVSGK